MRGPRFQAAPCWRPGHAARRRAGSGRRRRRSIGEQRVETGAAARAMGEHLAGPTVRRNPIVTVNRAPPRSSVTVSAKRRSGSLTRVIARLRSSRSPEEDCDCVPFVVVLNIEFAGSHSIDHRCLARISLPGDEALDGADRDP